MDHGHSGQLGLTAVLCVVEELVVDIASVTHRPQVAQDATVLDTRISSLTVTLTPVR